MKRLIAIAAALLAASALNSCIFEPKGPREMTLNAVDGGFKFTGFPGSTPDLDWASGDKATVFSGGNSSQFSVSGLPGHGAALTGSIEKAKQYFAVHPAISGATVAGGILTTGISASQAGIEGSVDKSLLISVAKGDEDHTFNFTNAFTVVSFSVEDDIASATLSTASGMSLAGGKVAIDCNSSGSPAVSLSEEGKYSVTLRGPFKQGSLYSFVVYPGKHQSGVTLTLESPDGGRATVLRSTQRYFNPGECIYIGDIEIKDSEWENGFFYMFKTPGIYDMRQEKVIMSLDPLTDQVHKARSESGNLFRIVNQAEAKVLEIKGIPSSPAVGQYFNGEIVQNYDSGIKNGSVEFVVTKVKDNKVWIETRDRYGFLIFN